MIVSDRSVGIARVYDQPNPKDGRRLLVDRLWPRGLRKEDPRIGEWIPAVAPSTELRQWYGHRPDRFAEFQRRYADELTEDAPAHALAELHDAARAAAPLTLLTATRDPGTSHLVVLARLLDADAGPAS